MPNLKLVMHSFNPIEKKATSQIKGFLLPGKHLDNARIVMQISFGLHTVKKNYDYVISAKEMNEQQTVIAFIVGDTVNVFYVAIPRHFY